MLAIRNARILTPQGEIDRGTIMMSDGRIDTIGALDAVAIRETAEVIEAGGLTAVPGLIDLQFNGGFGLDFTADPTTIWDVAAQLPQHGVTTFLPTIITSPLATVARAQAVLRDGPPREFVGARPLGLHIEGPFHNVGKKGAHNPAHLRPPTVEASAAALYAASAHDNWQHRPDEADANGIIRVYETIQTALSDRVAADHSGPAAGSLRWGKGPHV